MSDRQERRPKICGECAMVTYHDIGRGYCPVTKSRIFSKKPADGCQHFERAGDFKHGRRHGNGRSSKDVR